MMAKTRCVAISKAKLISLPTFMVGTDLPAMTSIELAGTMR